ncbi:unnamed protein product [Chrysoparadoxa australica]
MRASMSTLGMHALGGSVCPTSSRLPAAVVRGGATAYYGTQALVEHNVMGEALAELANIRTPAALLAGAALGLVFVNIPKDTNKRLRLLYMQLSITTATLELATILTTTISATKLAAIGTATGYSAVQYLMTHHELDFLIVRALFIAGVFSFLFTLVARSWLVFGKKEDRSVAWSMTTVIATCGSFLLSYFDALGVGTHLHFAEYTHMPCLYGLARRLLILSPALFSWRRLLRHIFFVGTIYTAVRLLIGIEEPTGDTAKE